MSISVPARSGSMRRSLCLLAAAAFAAAGAGVLPTVSSAAAATETCQGQPVTIVATQDNQMVTGTDGPDVISTAGHANVDVLAGAGDDLVCTDGGSFAGASNAGQVHGGPGDDTLVASSPSSQFDVAYLDGEDGDDVLEVLTGPASLRPGAGDDQIQVPAVPQLENGRPTIWVQFDPEVPGVHVNVAKGTIRGEGHDTVTGVLGFEGTAGRDVFIGGPRADFFTDDAGYDSKDPSADFVQGRGGDDVIEVFDGAIEGGGGDDRIFAWHSVVQGGYGDDHITLMSGGQVDGGPGADVIDTEIDAEDPPAIPNSRLSLDGGPGPDTISLASPEDEIGFKHDCGKALCRFTADGGTGHDVLSFLETGGKVRLDLATGQATYVGARARVRHVEKVEGSNGADVLRGTAHADHIDGNGGPDRLFGRGGPDLLHGGRGHDAAFGGPGRDRCVAEVRHSC